MSQGRPKRAIAGHAVRRVGALVLYDDNEVKAFYREAEIVSRRIKSMKRLT